MKKFLFLVALLFFVPEQKATDTQNIAITAVVSAVVSCGALLGLPKLYEIYHQTAQKKQTEHAQKEGDQLYDQLATKYASEIAAHELQQLSKKKLLEIIQNNNHSNNSHPVRPYSQSLNTDIMRLENAQYFEKNEESQQLIYELQQIRILKNNHLQKDYETAEKAFLELQFGKKKQSIELEKLHFEKEAARQHYQNEQNSRTILDGIKTEFKDMQVKMEQQTNALPAFISLIGQRLQQIETKIQEAQRDQYTQNNNDEIKRELKKLKTKLEYLYERKLKKDSEPSAPSFADLYEED